MIHLRHLPSDVVLYLVEFPKPQHPEDDAFEQEPNAADLFKGPRDPMRKDALLPREGSSGPSAGGQSLHNMHPPVPRLLCTFAFPKTMENKFPCTGLAETTDLNHGPINHPPPFIHRNRSMRS
jgi:hypothetical protein